MRQPNLFSRLRAGIGVSCALWCATSQALPIITSVTQTGGDDNANTPAQFTGQTYTHPNLGANYRVPAFGEEVAAFRDRVHQWTAATPAIPLPKYLLGGEMIQIRNDNRDNVDLRLDVTLSADAVVYLLIDNRRGDGNGANPPEFDTGMAWVVEDGFQPVITGVRRNLDEEFPDEIGVDEGADGAGPGQGVNQWASIYSKLASAGTFTLKQPDNGGRNMYGVVVKAIAKAPRFLGGSGDLLGFRFEIEEGQVSKLKADSLVVKLDGAAVTPSSVTLADGFWSVVYKTPRWLGSGSQHAVQVDFTDNASPAGQFSGSFNFTADIYPTLGSAHSVPASAVDLSSSGFLGRIAQFRDDARWPGADLPNDTRRAEDQLAGRLVDPTTGLLAENFAIPGSEPGGFHLLGMVNLSQEVVLGGAEQGGFTSLSAIPAPDEAIPGIPGLDPESNFNTDNIAGEFIAYLSLPAGLHQFGVNSDDGFRVAAGKDPRAPGAVQLGVFSGGRGAADSLFYVEVAEAGLYPVRLIWYEGGGGASVEFFTRDWATGEKRLVNDRANGGVVAHSKASAPGLSVSVSPLADSTGVSPGGPIQAQVYGVAGGALNTGAVAMKVNGAAVTPQISARNGVATILHTPAGLLPPGVNTVELTLVDTQGGSTTHSWSFTPADSRTFAVMPAVYAAPQGAVDMNSSGFLADSYQMTDGAAVVARTTFANNNSVEAAEHQFNRRFLNPATQQPYANAAFPGGELDGRHYLEMININQTSANQSSFTAANGYVDNPIPGFDYLDHNWVVVEFTTYLELKAGHHQFIVNCDDGFLLTTAPNPRSPAGAVQLGIRSPGGGATDAFVNVVVERDGFYPIRLLWWEGTGGANIEFTYVNPNTGGRVLVNDRTRAGTVRAFPYYNGPNRQPPTITITSPANDSQVPQAGGDIQVSFDTTVTGGTLAKVELFDSGTKIGEATSAPFQITIPAARAGRLALTAVATDSNGFTGRSAASHVLVGSPWASVNFQTATSPTPAGFLADSGAVFGDRGNGFSYGWDADNAANSRDRNSVNSPNQHYDTFTHSQRAPAGTIWEIEATPGTYLIYGVAGEPDNNDSVLDYTIEGATLLAGTPTAGQRFVAGRVEVATSDGRLTLMNGPTAANNKIAFLDIFQLSASPVITGIILSAEGVVVTWTGGGVLQSNDSLANAAGWVDVGSGGSHTEAVSGQAKFFRVKK